MDLYHDIIANVTDIATRIPHTEESVINICYLAPISVCVIQSEASIQVT